MDNRSLDTRKLSFATLDIAPQADHQWAENYPQKNWILYHYNLQRLIQHLRVALPQEDQSIQFRYLSMLEYHSLNSELLKEMQEFLDDAPPAHDLQRCAACHEEYKQLISGIKQHWITASPNSLNISLNSFKAHNKTIEASHQAFLNKKDDLVEVDLASPRSEDHFNENEPMVPAWLEEGFQSVEIPGEKKKEQQPKANPAPPINIAPSRPGYFASFTKHYPITWGLIKYLLLPAAAAAIFVFSGGAAATGLILPEIASFFMIAAGLSLVGNLFLKLGQSIASYFKAEPRLPNPPLPKQEAADNEKPMGKPNNNSELDAENELQDPEQIAMKDAVDVLAALHTTLDAQKQVKDQTKLRGVSSTVQDKEDNSSPSSPRSETSSVEHIHYSSDDFADMDEDDTHSSFFTEKDGLSFYQKSTPLTGKAPGSAPSSKPSSKLGSPSLLVPNNSPSTQPSSLSLKASEGALLRDRASSDPVPSSNELHVALSKLLQQPVEDAEETSESGYSNDSFDNESDGIPEELSSSAKTEVTTHTSSAPSNESKPQALKTNAYLARQMQQMKASQQTGVITAFKKPSAAERMTAIQELNSQRKEREAKALANEAKVETVKDRAMVFGVSEEALRVVERQLYQWKAQNHDQRENAMMSYRKAVHEKKAAAAQLAARLIDPRLISQGSNEPLVAGDIVGIGHTRQLSSTMNILGSLNKTGTLRMSIITNTQPLPDDQAQKQEAQVTAGVNTDNTQAPPMNEATSIDLGDTNKAEQDEEKKVSRHFV